MARSDKPRQHPRRRRLPRALTWLALLLVVLLAFGPMIVLNTPLLGTLTAGAVPPEAGSLTLQGAGGGWLAPMAAYGVELRDAQGAVVLQADEVRLSQSLVGLISGVEPVKVLVDRPVVNVVIRPDGSNLQDLLAALERSRKEQPAPADQTPEVAGRKVAALAVTQGTVYVIDASTGGHWTHQGLGLEVDLTGGLSKLEARARLGSVFNQFEPLSEGDLTPNFSLSLDPADGSRRSVSLGLSAAPLNAAEPLARRADASLRLTGAATGQGAFAWNADASDATPQTPAQWVDALMASGLTSSGSVTVDAFAIRSGLLGGDTLRLDRVQAPWEVRVENGRLVLPDAQVASADVGSVRVRGALSADEIKAFLAAGPAAWRAAGRWPVGRVAADLDLARLAELAPAAVALRADVRPVSGRLTAQLDTEPESGARVSGSVTASELVAEAAGARVGWEKPFKLAGSLSLPGGVLTIDSLRCESEFLYGDLSGSLTNLNGNLGFDLDKLAEQAGKFVDLSGWRLAGRGNSTVRVEATGADRRKATLVASMNGVLVARRGEVYLEEDELNASASGEALLDAAQQPRQLVAARVALESADDLLEVTLAAPVRLDAPEAAPVSASVRGNLASWQNRLRVALAPLGGSVLLRELRLGGQLNLVTSARLGGGVLQLDALRCEVNQVRVDGLGLAVREPRVMATGDFAWVGSTATLESRQGELVSSTVALKSEGVRASLAADQVEASGRLAVRADLARLNDWFIAGDRPRSTGEVEARVEFTQNQGVLRAAVTGGGKNVAFLDAATRRPLLEEPALSINATASYAKAAGQLTIESATITSNTLRVLASGATQNGATQLSGTVDYDLTALAPVIAGYLGPEVVVTGRHQGSFSLTRAATAAGATAPHWSRAWRGRVEAPWSSISLFGLPIGAGRLGLTLADGQAVLDPVDLAVSGGRLTTRLSARLDPAPAAWGATPGPVLTGVQVTPEISHRLLKYIAPVLADATRSQGVFSLQVDSAGGPFDPLIQLGAKGRLNARSVMVTPGPTTVQLVQIAKQIEALVRRGDPTALLGAPASDTTLLSISERTIDFNVVNGRVHHAGLEFNVGDVTIQSSGSVGFDETLDLVLAVPIKDNWIGARPLLQGLRGKVVQIPVRGRFGAAQIDDSAFRSLSENLLRDGVRGAIGGALQQLFGQ